MMAKRLWIFSIQSLFAIFDLSIPFLIKYSLMKLSKIALISILLSIHPILFAQKYLTSASPNQGLEYGSSYSTQPDPLLNGATSMSATLILLVSIIAVTTTFA